MASPAERMTVDYPFRVVAMPKGHATVKGKPRKIEPSDLAAIRENRATAQPAPPSDGRRPGSNPGKPRQADGG